MDSATRRLVRDRAGHRCEYCGLPQEALPLSTFHVEHITAKQHGGSDDADNLALACHHCNLHKGPNLTGIDPETGAIVHLFHPRRDDWADHFEGRGAWVGGLTPVGRATRPHARDERPGGDRGPLRLCVESRRPRQAPRARAGRAAGAWG